MAAATDQTYRNQTILDYVFAASCVILLGTTVWMFVQDYYREFKSIQRDFRDVEEAMAQRTVLDYAPDAKQRDAIVAAEDAVIKAKDNLAQVKKENVATVREKYKKDPDTLLADKIKSQDHYQAIKADYDSIVSLYDIAVEERNGASGAYREHLEGEVKKLLEQVNSLKKRLDDARLERDQKIADLDDALAPQKKAEKELSDAEDALKKKVADFDRFAKQVEQKRWGVGDSFRKLPIIDAFASPVRIKQYTLDQLPIDYAFKFVTRYDRCTTCHLGIESAAYTKKALADLGQQASPETQEKLENAKEALRKRQEISKSPGVISPNDLQLAKVQLTPAQITQYAVHPRLDLFVDATSPHGAEKFGCTICHAGQGSATDFFNASHTPSNSLQADLWHSPPSKANNQGGHDWQPNHYWDFPMLPNRFIESSCVKCHYEMTDLIRDGSRVEAPKLMRGYNLVKDNGCFGCHEIAGIKGGRPIGPDLRLEPDPPLEELSPAERAKAQSDPLNPLGTLRKVGPNLRRISEKTNEEWVRKWLRAPRDFRPDTKMPHFYGLSNNQRDVLPAEQRDFPDAEIHSIVHYLFQRSQGYLKGVEERHQDSAEARSKDQQLHDALAAKPELTAEEKQQLRAVRQRMGRRQAALPVAHLQLPPVPADAKEQEQQRANGRRLFSEKGCLACHIHQGTATPGLGLPAIAGEAQFAPNLSRLAAKLGTKSGDVESARRWLVQWIMNPTIHHPRTRMPVTHLTQEEANDVAAWLLSQKVTDWAGPDVAEPDEKVLKELARVFLSRAYTKREVDEFLAKGISSEFLTKANKPLDADERELETKPGEAQPIEHKLKMYIGKKAIGQLGCYACHYIPGFSEAKPIGTPLNDWGKKDPERLAFEDVTAYVKENYQIVDQFVDKDNKPIVPSEKTNNGRRKELYEKYFADLLNHHQREGFLHQKLTEPRSYDYDRLRAWDDRLRMPQFRFARSERKKDESEEAFEARQQREEAEAREAVMTFILGLVAEPIPLQYVHHPAPERLAEVRGRQIIDKFNCAGCHLVRPGVYEFKSTGDTLKGLEANYNTAKTTFGSDHFFADHNAWVGLPQTRSGQLKAFGLRKEMAATEEGQPPDQLVFLSDALRFTVPGDKPQTFNIPAASTIILPKKEAMISSADNFGGTFGDVLVGYLMQKDRQRFNPDDKARPAVPPSLLREGEKTQPAWLFGFLKEPQAIRPVTVLRMPKFNMSDEEAMALVNYFSAVDKLGNPAAGLSAPYFTIPEKDEDYIKRQTAEYIQRLKKAKAPNKDTSAYDQRLEEMKPIWEDELKRRVFDLQTRLEDAKADVKKAQETKAKPEDLKKLQDAQAALEKELDAAKNQEQKKDIEPLKRRWEEKEAYLIDGYRVLAGEAVCRNCHQVGSLPPKEQQGPPLALTFQRLRPDWSKRWLANPQRFMTYPTPMPQNFARNAHQFQDLVEGQSIEQVIAARDALFNYPLLIDMPANRQRPVTVAGGK
jgi:mono/diheme cytochrome c family protein